MRWCVLLVLIVAASARADDGPPLPAGKRVAGGVTLYDVHLSGYGPGHTQRLMIYVPAGTAAAAHTLPCVFVAPAGTNLVTGNTLGDGDAPEQLPYATAGFVAVGYELDGQQAGHTFTAMTAAVPKFMAAHGGVDDARVAVDYVLSHVPAADPARVYTAGHSSAGTVALDVAAADPRVTACCAYAPAPDIGVRLGKAAVTAVDRHIPGFAAFVDAASPARHLAALKGKAVLLFTAQDDANVPSQSVQDFAAQLQQTDGVTAKLVVVPTGGHYQSMRRQGIRAGIEFLKGQASSVSR